MCVHDFSDCKGIPIVVPAENRWYLNFIMACLKREVENLWKDVFCCRGINPSAVEYMVLLWECVETINVCICNKKSNFKLTTAE
jgi:hypothetical protein